LKKTLPVVSNTARSSRTPPAAPARPPSAWFRNATPWTRNSPCENLIVYARYFGIPKAAASAKADELLDFAQLTERADSKVEPLSGGMKRRLTIARSLVNDPEILLLEEPTTGLDPQARHVLWTGCSG